MNKNEIFTSQEGQNLMEFINVQVENAIDVAREKGHEYFAYTIKFKVEEQQKEGCVVMPLIESYSSNSLNEMQKETQYWETRALLKISGDKIIPAKFN